MYLSIIYYNLLTPSLTCHEAFHLTGSWNLHEENRHHQKIPPKMPLALLLLVNCVRTLHVGQLRNHDLCFSLHVPITNSIPMFLIWQSSEKNDGRKVNWNLSKCVYLSWKSVWSSQIMNAAIYYFITRKITVNDLSISILKNYNTEKPCR